LASPEFSAFVFKIEFIHKIDHPAIRRDYAVRRSASARGIASGGLRIKKPPVFLPE
jgi:hypothetical protein